MTRLKRSGEHREPGEPAGNPRLLSVARDLQRRKSRERRALFVAEGVRSVEEVVRARVPLKGAIVSPQLEESARGRSLLEALEHRAPELVRISPRELATVADTDSPQGVLAIAEVPHRALDDVRVDTRSRVLILDGVQDPGNVGTILRTAAAFGAAAVIALPGTVDLWNPKVVRGAMGAHFQLPALHCEAAELLAWLERNSVELWGTDAHGDTLPDASTSRAVAIAVGNEGTGVSSALRSRASRIVSLPVERGVESLNVAVAAGVLLFVLRERLRT